MIFNLINKLRKWRYNRRVTAEFRKAYLDFLKDPKRASDMRQQDLLRGAFIGSHGQSLDWAWKLQKEISPHQRGPVRSGIFPALDEAEVEKAIKALRSDGYYILPWRMSAEWVRAATEKAKKFPVVSRADPKDIQLPGEIQPKSATYWHNDKDLYQVEEFRELALDPGIQEIIGRYLECKPVFDMVAAWWSFPAGKADSASAQLYHFDLDRVRWLKVFVVLTDVGPENGPHAFVKGSHNNIGNMVHHHGRYSDEDVFNIYPKCDEVLFTAPAGTVFLENTLGFHKGNAVQKGHRFLFEFEYSINHFGYPYPGSVIS
jgi:hypothetical protein